MLCFFCSSQGRVCHGRGLVLFVCDRRGRLGRPRPARPSRATTPRGKLGAGRLFVILTLSRNDSRCCSPLFLPSLSHTLVSLSLSFLLFCSIASFPSFAASFFCCACGSGPPAALAARPLLYISSRRCPPPPHFPSRCTPAPKRPDPLLAIQNVEHVTMHTSTRHGKPPAWLETLRSSRAHG